MKVVITTPYYLPNLGGVEVHVYNLASRLSRKHDVKIITGKGEGENVVTLPCLQIPYSPLPLYFPNLNADIYHSHVPSPFLALEIARRGKHPHVVTYHNDVVVPEVVDGRYIPKCVRRVVEGVNARIVRKILDKADVIIATTRDYAKTSDVLRDYDVTVVPNGIDYRSFSPGPPAGEREKIVLYTGRIVAYKGLKLLIDAMAQIEDAKLVVVGDGEDRESFEKYAERKGVNALFTGRVNEEEKIMWMRKCRVLVLPSLNRLEAFGIVLLEAMATGTPVIASNLPGVREVAKLGGCVFKNLDDLVGKIECLLNDDRKATELGKRGRRNARFFDWEIIVERIEGIYEDLI